MHERTMPDFTVMTELHCHHTAPQLLFTAVYINQTRYNMLIYLTLEVLIGCFWGENRASCFLLPCFNANRLNKS